MILLILAPGLFAQSVRSGADEPASRSGEPSLWNRAVAVASANDSWVPGKAELVSEELDRRGAAKSTEVRLYRVRPGEDGKLYSDLTYAAKNGKDITAEEIKKQDKAATSGRGNGVTLPNPFAPQVQESVQEEATGTQELVNGQLCSKVSFSFSPDGKQDYSGTAWILPATSVPVKVVMNLRQKPLFVDYITLTIRYNPADDHWYALDATFEGAGRILFITRHYKISMRFSDYSRALQTP